VITYLKVLKNISKSKYLYIIIFGMILFLSFMRINFKEKVSKYSINDNSFVLKVTSLKYQNEKYIVELSGKEKLISYCDVFPYDVGDILSVKGTLSIINKNTIPNLFNYQNYYNNKNIFYRLNIEKMVLERKNNSLLNRIKIKIRKRIEIQQNNEYLYAFILGDTSYLDKDNYKYNGVSFLLSVGSFQVLSITYVLEIIKRKFKIPEKYFLLIISLILLGYLWQVSFKIGILRCSLCYILRRLLKYYKKRMKYSDVILIVGSLLILIEPRFLYNVSFYYSFIISYGLSMIKKIKGNYFKRIFIISLYANILSFPITIYTNYEVNFLSSLISVILMPMIHFIIFPLCIISFIFPSLNIFLNFFVSMINDINTLFTSISIFYFIFRKPSIIVLLLYYLVIFLFLKKKRYGLIILLMMLIHLNINKIIKEEFVIFLDVREGDSILIKSNDKVSLIDTGGNVNYDYSKDIIKYIHSLGITKIENIFFTHGDYDHLGSGYELIKNIKVRKVYFNNDKYNENEKKIINLLESKKISYEKIDKMKMKVNNFEFLIVSYSLSTENDSSMMFMIKNKEIKLMLMGDATVESENMLLKEYNLANIDILKLGHHGSKTSTGITFWNKVKPLFSVISVGLNNKYHLPSPEVMERIKKSNVFLTSIHGSIMFKIKNNKLELELCSP